MKIEPEKFYSGLQAVEILGMKSRQYLSEYINNGNLLAITTGKGSNKRYAIKGEWLKDFKTRYDRGLVTGEKHSIRATKLMLDRAIKYCDANGINTLEEFIESVNNLDK